MAESIQLSPLVREIFTKYGTRRRYHAGEVLEQKGDAALQAGYLAEGHIRTFCLSPNGDEISLFYLGPGELFGSAALLSRSPVMVSLSAVTDAEGLPAAGGPLLGPLGRGGRDAPGPADPFCPADRHAVRLSLLRPFHGGRQAVAYFLHTCCAASGPRHPLHPRGRSRPSPGMSRISVTRILRRFREAGILRQAYRRIEVLQPHRLLEVFGSLGYFLD